MRRALLASGVGICLACGGGDESQRARTSPEEEIEANRPPDVVSVAIAPEHPTTEDALTAALRVIDPDRDRVSIDVTWYRNGSVYDDTGRQVIDPHEFVRDDRVWFEASISDGAEEIVVHSDPVTIANALPTASAIRITPPEPSAADMLEVEMQGGDADGDPVTWSYRWQIDGVAVEGAQTKRLPPGRARRGARVVAEVSGNDGFEHGEWSASPSVVLGNAAPKVTTQPVYGLASPGRYVYEVKAEDPDGDQPLRFELGSGPPGMAIDLVSGVITWPVPQDAQGAYPVEIAVSDPHGGRAVQRYTLEVSWQPVAEKRSPGEPASASRRARSGGEDDDADELDEESPASESEDEIESGDEAF
jgi:hypothetical protein